MVMTKEQYDALTQEYTNKGKALPTPEDIKFMLETFTPYGDVQTAKDASTAFQEGRYLDAAGNAALIGLGYTPLGPVVRPAGRLAKRAMQARKYNKFKKEAAKRAGPLNPYFKVADTGNPILDKRLNQNIAYARTNLTRTEKDLIDGLSPFETKFQKDNPGTELLYVGSNPSKAEDLRALYREGQFFGAPDPYASKTYGTELTGIPMPKGTMEKIMHKNRIEGAAHERAKNREQAIIGPIGEAYRKKVAAEGTQFENDEAIDFLEEMYRKTGMKPFKIKD